MVRVGVDTVVGFWSGSCDLLVDAEGENVKGGCGVAGGNKVVLGRIGIFLNLGSTRGRRLIGVVGI